MKTNKKIYLSIGIFLVGYGIYTLAQEGEFVRMWGAPVVPKLVQAALFLVLGFLGILCSLSKNVEGLDDEYVKCLSCKRPFNKKDTQDGKCPDCGGVVEDIEGFFDRHPDLK